MKIVFRANVAAALSAQQEFECGASIAMSAIGVEDDSDLAGVLSDGAEPFFIQRSPLPQQHIAAEPNGEQHQGTTNAVG